jgi:hypothetical protein
MKPILIAGITIVNIALISYSVAIFSEQRKRNITNKVLIFLSLGVVFDIASTVCMVIGSSHTAFSSHGILGYSSLLGMLIDSILLWRFRIKNDIFIQINKNLHIYSRFAYIWWVFAYITGIIIVALR